MKRKITIITCACIALLLGVALVVHHVSGLKITAEDASEVFTQVSESDEKWNSVSTGDIFIENEQFTLKLSCETAHFMVTDKESGKVYYSVAQATANFEPDAEHQSEMIITYYDNNSAKTTMNTYANSVEGQSFEIKTDGSAIRVYYSVQKSKQVIFVPEVISQEVFEEDILSKLESGPKRRLKSFYTLYESDSDDSKEMKETYSALANENLYILNGTAGEHNYSEITGYMEKAGYNQSNYAEEVERLGLDSGVGENQPAAFVIPVEYVLTEDGFAATVLNDRITSNSENYKLTNVSLLPYFASCGYSQDGWFLVPDGSGAIIEMDEKGGYTYSQSLWGNDAAVESSVKSNLMQNAGLPVFALHNGNESFFAEVTGAAATATVNASVIGKEITQNNIYADFNILAFDTSDMGEMRNQAEFNIYASEYMAEFPQVTYTLLSECSITYSDMANLYREKLIERGILGERLEEEQVPVFFDFTGYETVEESILGVSVNAETVLSSIEGVNQTLDELEERGIGGIHVRFKAYANNGIYSKVSNGFELEKCVGTLEELQKLAKRLQETGGKLYLENNISTVYLTGNSFKKMTHAVRNLKKTVAEGIDFDLIAREREEAVNEYYLTSPAYFNSLTQNFVDTLSKESGDVSIYGYSWSDFGSALWSDFHSMTPYDRTESMHAAVGAMEKVGESFDEVMTDGSNAYVLSEASVLLNIPLNASALSCESYSIPFYQMVIHGYIEYSGAPVNTGADMGKTYLASVESGANLYYSCYTSDEEPLKQTEAGTLIYPTYVAASYDKIEEQYLEFNELFTDLRCQTIIGHTRVADNVFITTYERGTQIVVNYSDTDIEVNGVSIPARGFAVSERGR